MMQMIFLIGFMGTGKSAAARALAVRDGFTCDDLDERIESAVHCSIAEYMDEHGEQAFRDRESEELAAWIRERRQESDQSDENDPSSCAVLACGGGTVLREENRRLMREAGLVIRLTASLQSIFQRVSAEPQSRPLLQGGRSLPERLEELAKARAGIYAASADAEVSSEGKSAQETAGLILQTVADLS